MYLYIWYILYSIPSHSIFHPRKLGISTSVLAHPCRRALLALLISPMLWVTRAGPGWTCEVVDLILNKSLSPNNPSDFFPNAWQGFPFHSGGLGVEGVFPRRCVYVRNRSQPSARAPYGRAYGKFCKRGHFWILVEVAHVALLRFAWHVWHFVTSRRVL